MVLLYVVTVVVVVVVVAVLVVRIYCEVGTNQEEPWATTGYDPLCWQRFSKHCLFSNC